MITNIYKRLMAQNTSKVPSSLSVKNLFGTSRSVSAMGSSSNYKYVYGGTGHTTLYPTSDNAGQPSDQSFRFIFGTGTTPETAADFQLEAMANMLTPTASDYSPSYIRDTNNDIIGIKKSVTFVNNGTSTVSISEVGVAVVMHYVGTQSGYVDWFLMDRTVLDTPLTVEPSGTVTFDLNIIY